MSLASRTLQEAKMFWIAGILYVLIIVSIPVALFSAVILNVIDEEKRHVHK